MANAVTGIRILCSIALLFSPALSPAFYVIYVIAGISDIADGAIARMTHTESNFGARLDTAADFIFALSSAVKLLPALPLKPWMWVWLSAVAIVKICTAAYHLIRYKHLADSHTAANKLAGTLIFLLPFTLRAVDFRYSAAIALSAATVAALSDMRNMRSVS